ncbi:MAG: glycosyltransferase family 4 protein [Pseudomonadota bacterium]
MSEDLEKTSRSLLVIHAPEVDVRTGGGQRTHIFYNALRQRGPVEILALAESEDLDVAAAFSDNPKVHYAFSSKMPGSASLLRRAKVAAMKLFLPSLWFRIDPKLAEFIASNVGLDRFDAICCRHYQPFVFSGIRRGKARVLVDVDDFDSQTLISRLRSVLGGWSKRNFLFEFLERRLTRLMLDDLEQSDCVIFSTQQDFLELKHPASALVPNVAFFDTDFELPAPSASRDVLFVGSYYHPPNQAGLRWFLENCWPEIHRQAPEAKLRVVGRGGWVGFDALEPKVAGVEVVGDVQDVVQEYARVRIAISPINSGGGSKIKVVEGCAFARPVVCLPHSTRGFEDRLVQTLHVCADADAFVEVTLNLLRDDELANESGRAAQQAQRATYSRQASEKKIVEALDEALARSDQPVG